MANRLCGTLVLATVVAGATPALARQAAAGLPAQGPPQAQAPPPTASSPPDAAPATDTVYSLQRDRVTPPRVQRQVKPTYTPEAMRNRIQGSVRLQAIVERDGTVSGITVVESLDPQYGLDQSAVDALKQWRFQPGTLADGTPVRVLVSVDLTFTLRDGPLPASGWPEGFRDDGSVPGAVEERAEMLGLRLTMTRPSAWTISRASLPGEWISVTSADGSETVTVMRPEPAEIGPTRPGADTRVPRLIERLRQLQETRGIEPINTGQLQVSTEVSWVWAALRVPDLSNVSGLTLANPTGGEARSWLFVRTVSDRALFVQCTVLVPRGGDPADALARAQRAGADFAAIIKSIVVDGAN